MQWACDLLSLFLHTRTVWNREATHFQSIFVLCSRHKERDRCSETWLEFFEVAEIQFYWPVHLSWACCSCFFSMFSRSESDQSKHFCHQLLDFAFQPFCIILLWFCLFCTVIRACSVCQAKDGIFNLDLLGLFNGQTGPIFMGVCGKVDAWRNLANVMTVADSGDTVPSTLSTYPGCCGGGWLKSTDVYAVLNMLLTVTFSLTNFQTS